MPSDASITCEVLTCATSERGPNAKGLMVMKKSTFRNEPINKFHFIPDPPCRISSRGGRFPLAAIRVAAARCRNEPISRSACKSRAHLESRGGPPVRRGPASCAGQRIVPSDAPITCEVLTCATSVHGPNAKGLLMKKSTFRNEPINKFHFIPDAPCRISSRRGRFPQAAIRVAVARCRNEPISG